MFTGIVTDVGKILSVREIPEGRRSRISTSYDVETIEIGSSIACGGPCHTVVEKGGKSSGSWFEVESSTETIELTTAGLWNVGDRLNLERSLKVGDELGGHMVSGHVDGLSVIREQQYQGESVLLKLEAPSHLMRFVAPKGSVALDGTSLTVNKVENDTFTVLLIPHTVSVTTWSERKVGDKVNLEVDLMARYAARLAEAG